MKESIVILLCLATECTHLNHVHQSRFELKAIIALVIVQSSRDVTVGRAEYCLRVLAMGGAKTDKQGFQVGFFWGGTTRRLTIRPIL